MKFAIFFQWLILLLASVACLYFTIYFWQLNKVITAFLFLALGIALILSGWFRVQSKLMETEKIINAILKKDYTLYPKKTKDNDLKNSAVQLYYQSKNENLQLTSYKQLYEDILNKLEIGFMILHKSKDSENWKVFHSNPAILQILQVPKYNDWDFYREKTPLFYELIAETKYQDSQEFIDISIQQSNKQSYSIRTSRISSPEQIFCVISLESVQKIIDRKEKLAWNNLMKVISHELLNTLTPVNSLIHNMEYLTEQKNFGEEEQSELRESLKIINSKSQQLLHFIDSYRQVAELPKPKKTQFNVARTIENVAKIFENELKTRKISLQLQLREMQLFADEKMVERIIVNLVTNSIHALDKKEIKEITIENFNLNNRNVLRVTDSGEGIEPSIQDKIFLPFFTTRQNGSGIGLTLAKSIMEAHNGYILHKNSENGSIFEAWFV